LSDETGGTDEPQLPPMTPPAPNVLPPQPPSVIYVQQVPMQTNGLAVASLVLGIIGLVLFWTVWGGILLGILAVIFGAVGLSKAGRGGPNKGMATAGLVLGVLAIIGSVLFIAFVVSVANNVSDQFQQVGSAVNGAGGVVLNVPVPPLV